MGSRERERSPPVSEPMGDDFHVNFAAAR